MKPFRMQLALATSLLTLSLAACSTNTTGTDAKKIAEAIGHIEPSKKDTCDTQKQIAEQSSKIDTIRKGQEVVYKADCSKKG